MGAEHQMPTSVESRLNEIAGWLGEELGGEVDVHFEHDTFTYYLRVEWEQERLTPVFRVTLAALEDWDAVTIIDDLQQNDLVERLRSDPTLWPLYNNRREVPYFESRSIRCGGRPYRVVRDATHNVKVYDSHDRVLEQMPAEMLVRTGSIFMVPEEEWCQEIRRWRGPGQ